MSRIINPLIFVISCTIFVIGIWEAIVSVLNSPYMIHLNYHDDEIFALTTTKSVCNIIIGGFLSVSSFYSSIFTPDKEDIPENNKENCLMSLLKIISFGTSIWVLVRYFNTNFYNSLIGPYQCVLIIETIICLSTIGFIVFGTFSLLGLCLCLKCCYLAKEDDEYNRGLNTEITETDENDPLAV